jgi:type IV secretion system protein VirD4
MNSRALGFAALRARHSYPTRPAMYAGAALGVGLAADVIGGTPIGGPLTALALTAEVGINGLWWLRDVVRPQGTRGEMVRASAQAQRAGGVAAWYDVQEHASPAALRRRRRELRPSLAEVRRPHPEALGVCLATTGTGRLPGQRVYSTCQDVSLRIGGPRKGKTQSLACHGLDAPGALLTTSTRADLARWVHAARTAPAPDQVDPRASRDVHVMNPTGYRGIASTVRWSVLVGCEDYSTAQRRAGDLVPEDHAMKDAAFWAGKARDVLALYLHAAALDGRRTLDVVRWAQGDEKTVQDRICGILRVAGPGGPSREQQLRQHYSEPPNTRKSVVATLSTALSWLADDGARILGDADRETITLNVERFILQKETLHLIAGTKVVSGVSNLIAAIVSEVTYQARQIAGRMPDERLDPPLTVLLDEAALICPVPLPRWTADMGGRNITLHISIQSIAQMRERWGKDGASTILGNVGAFVVFGGSQDTDELESLSRLSGEMRVRVVGEDHDRPDHKNDGEKRGEWRWVPVLSPAQISALRPGQVFVRRYGLPTVVGWAPQVWQRKGVQAVDLPVDPEVTPAHGIPGLPLPADTTIDEESK